MGGQGSVKKRRGKRVEEERMEGGPGEERSGSGMEEVPVYC